MSSVVAVLLVLSPLQLEAVNGPYTHGHPMSISHVAAVERWRPLIENHFPTDQVGTAMRILECESGGDPLAKNRGSSAAGLFQFLHKTWDAVAQETGSPSYAQGGPYDPEWSIINAAWLVENVSWNQWSCY